jgi:photosystem II stability/assembly factor-like uncharacterized protein
MRGLRKHLNRIRLLNLTAVLLFGAVTCLAQTGTWSKQRSGTLAWMHSVFFLNENRGWAVGSRGTLLGTDNGGNNWQLLKRPTEDIIRDIYFTDENNGWLVCERNIYDLKLKDEPRTYLMTTTDGGDHWSRVNVSGVDIDARLTRALFSDSGRAWTFGEGGSIFTSKDGGVNWIKLSVPTRHLLLGGTFIDDDRGWLVGAGATILQTSDGGDTWHRSRLAGLDDVRFTAASFIDNRIGWAVGSTGTILKTTNGGRIWTTQNSGLDSDLLDVKFLDAREGWAVGAEGTVIYTNDGGTRWETERSETTHPLERVFFVDRNHGWAVGFGGTIISYIRTEAPRKGQ